MRRQALCCALLLVVAAHSAKEVQPLSSVVGTRTTVSASVPHSRRRLAAAPLVLVSGGIDVSARVQGRAVASSFAGHSIEWDNPRKTGLSEYNKQQIARQGPNYDFATMLNTPGYIPLLKLLANGNANGPFVIRMGGNSEDLVETIRTTTLQMLARLKSELGANFIIGLNFLQERTKRLPLAQTQQVLKFLPNSSVLGWEIGNEPNYKSTGFAGAAFSRYLQLWAPVRAALTPMVGNKVAGPAWSYPNMPAANLTAMLDANGKGMSLVTAHYYYASAAASTSNYRMLLDEKAVSNAVSAAAPNVVIAKKFGKPFRIAECNSFYGGGLAGASNVFAATLWGLDFMLAMANVGASGTDFHGYETTPYNSLQRTKLANGSYTTVAKPVFYGQWLFQKAAAGGVSIVPVRLSRSTANVKVWALKPRSGTGLRLVIINKTGTTGQAGFSVRGLPPAQRQGRSYQLTAPAASAGSGVRFGGITAEAAAAGAALRYNFVKGTSASGVLKFSVDVPKYWAGLFVF